MLFSLCKLHGIEGEMRLGIDFGTTHTTAAFYDVHANGDGRSLHFVPLDAANKDPHLLRSMIYMTREHETILGLDAVQTYLRDNTGRIAKLEQKVVGTIENTVARVTRAPTEPDGPIVIIYDVIIEEDVSAPGRLLQSIKTGLRDPEYPGTTIYDQFFTVPELISILLKHVKARAEDHFQTEMTEVTLGRPVIFSEMADADMYAQQRLEEAAKLAGFSHIQFELEPVAAALFHTRQFQKPQMVLVFDFGGGTLDLTVMQANAWGETKILATQGVLVGGDDLDTAVMRGKVASYFGTESSIDRQNHPFPAHLGAKLDRWQTIPDLSKTENISIIRQARVNGNNPNGFLALECLALKNYGFPLFEVIEQSKRHLSAEELTHLRMNVEDIDLNMELTRREFQTLILEEMAQVQLGIQEVLRKAGLAEKDIDVVVTTGGSSLIPVFKNLLMRRFTEAEHVHSDTFGSVAAGLAIRANAE